MSNPSRDSLTPRGQGSFQGVRMSSYNLDAPVSGSKSCNRYLAGDKIDPNSFLHDDVLCFDHHASWQKIIFVNHFHIAHVHGPLSRLSFQMNIPDC